MFSKDIKTVKNRLNYCYDLISMKDRFNQGSTNDKDTMNFLWRNIEKVIKIIEKE